MVTMQDYESCLFYRKSLMKQAAEHYGRVLRAYGALLTLVDMLLDVSVPEDSDLRSRTLNWVTERWREVHMMRLPAGIEADINWQVVDPEEEIYKSALPELLKEFS